MNSALVSFCLERVPDSTFSQLPAGFRRFFPFFWGFGFRFLETQPTKKWRPFLCSRKSTGHLSTERWALPRPLGPCHVRARAFGDFRRATPRSNTSLLPAGAILSFVFVVLFIFQPGERLPTKMESLVHIRKRAFMGHQPTPPNHAPRARLHGSHLASGLFSAESLGGLLEK